MARRTPTPGRAQPPARLAPADRAADAMRARRLAAERAPPPKADPSVWNDPDDLVRTRSPRQVRGYRRGDAIGRLHRQGADVTRDHVEAASLFRADWDVARLGLSNRPALIEAQGGGGFAPVSGPPAAALATARAQREVARALRMVGPAAVPLLLWVVVDNRDVKSWCAQAQAAGGRKPDRARETGRLIATLDRLTEFYGVDSRAEQLRDIRRELAQR